MTLPEGLEIQRFEQPPFGTNSYLILPEGMERAWVVDPSGDPASLLGRVKSLGRRVERILLTHGHMDHWIGAKTLQEAWGVPVFVDARDRHLVDPEAGRLFGYPLLPVPEDLRDYEGEHLELGPHAWRLVHAPGHSPGHLVFMGEGHALVGDVVFAGSIGRMDLPGGDETTMRRTLREVILPLPPDYDLLPGHGPPTTAGREARSNPYLRRDGGWISR